MPGHRGQQISCSAGVEELVPTGSQVTAYRSSRPQVKAARLLACSRKRRSSCEEAAYPPQLRCRLIRTFV
eukprot:scaffold133836_cov17-Tisochrysis_lutea.AAC.1